MFIKYQILQNAAQSLNLAKFEIKRSLTVTTNTVQICRVFDSFAISLRQNERVGVSIRTFR